MPRKAAEIRAAGQNITLADGTTATLRYDFAAIARIEDEFGSVSAMFDALRSGKAYSTLATVLWIGAHTDLPLNDFLASLDVRQTAAYTEAWNAAISETFGSGDDEGEAPAAENAATN